ncbi:hypothetical protein NHQ30_009136 [Ciborinia camelliae]|nr:hypothetical protein NHQ30_009136 [Ciborinia camelliae]
MLHFSYRRVMISSRIIHNVSRSPSRQRITKRVFSQTARAGNIDKDEEHGNGFKISRISSSRQKLVRSVTVPAYNPTVAGETVVENLGDNTKSGPQLALQPKMKIFTKDSCQSSTESQDDNSNKNINDGHSDSTTSKVVLKSKSMPIPRQFSISSPDPKRTTKEEVLKLIKSRSRMSKAQYFGDYTSFGSEEAVVILVTPAFAKWLEDDENFIKGVLECLTHHHVDNKPNYVVVVAAVVDGLAPSPGDIPIAERAGPLEGFSFLYGVRTQLLSPKNVWEPESYKNDLTNPAKLSHLIFSGKSCSKQSEQSLATTISLPLANTLFVNGKHSTLETSQWTRRNMGEYKCLQSVEKQYQRIKVFHHESTTIPPIFVPAVPLTLPRPIANGLGNIIRQLSFGPEDTDNRPASSELESQVTRYMAFSERHATIGVWALIYRKEILDPNLKATTLEMTEQLESTWGNDDQNLRFVGTQIALGAILCRVVSGGGGWGSKQGLLSLDPQLTYEDIASARFDYTPHSIEEGQDSKLGNLARRGDHIQFFTINPNKLKEYETPMEHPTSTDILGVDHNVSDDRVAVEKYITKEPEKTGLTMLEAIDLSWSNKVVFGVVPSTIDKLPQSEINDASTALKDKVPFLNFRKGEFGAVTESGIYLHSSHQKRVTDKAFELINTKIDMPYSYLYRDQPGTSPQEIAEHEEKLLLGSEAASLPEGGSSKLSLEGNDTPKTHPLIRKWRVGHTRWPKFSPQPETKSPIRRVNVGTSETKSPIRRVNVGTTEIKLRFLPV